MLRISLFFFVFVCCKLLFCSRLNHSLRSREAPGTQLLSVLTFNLENGFSLLLLFFCFFLFHHVNWVYISNVIRLCVSACVGVSVSLCVSVCLSVRSYTEEKELSGFLAESVRLLSGASTCCCCCCCLIDWHQRGVESLLDISVCPGNWSKD